MYLYEVNQRSQGLSSWLPLKMKMKSNEIKIEYSKTKLENILSFIASFF